MRIVFLSLLLVLLQKDPTASAGWAVVSGDTAMVYATVDNPTMYDVYLVSGKSDIAAKVELLDGEKVVTSLTVPAYGSLELKTDGPRIRLAGVKGPLNAADRFHLTVETDSGVPIAIAALVKQ